MKLCTPGLLLLLPIPAMGQTSATPLEFEAASIKVNNSADATPSGNFLRGGQLSVKNITMKQLLTAAYHIQDSQLSGAPGWVDSDRFDVSAKAVADTNSTTCASCSRIS